MTAGILIDYLTCGGCAREFPLKDITNFIQHKKVDCQDAVSLSDKVAKGTNSPRSAHSSEMGSFGSWEITQIGPNETALSCFTCAQDFVTARGLLHHVQLSHNLKIFFQRDTFNRHSDTGPQSDQSFQGVSHMTSSESQHLLEDCDNNQRTTVEINQKDGTVKTKISPTCAELAAAGGTTICCNSKECCVTIIPGTHERPKKCCSAVVPKKRKRHMEEHMNLEEERDEDLGELEAEMEEEEEDKENRDENFNEYDDNDDGDDREGSSDAIYIDFRPRNHSNQNEGKDSSSRNDPDDGDRSWGTLEVRQGKSDDSENSSNPSESNADQGSVIMEPGMTFSIPVSYSFAASCSPNAQPVQSQTLTSERTGSFSAPVFYSLPQKATFSVGTSKIMTISSSSTPFMRGAHQNMTQILKMQGRDDVLKSGTSQNISTHGSTGEGDMEEERLMIDMDSDHGDEDLANDNDGSPDKGGGKKRRYPTSRPFKCDQCDHAFNQRIHLKKHMSKHTGVKPFKCQQCDYSTVERSHLKVHIRIHTGEKPFKCTFCEYATAQNSTLKIHLKRHHGGKMFECQTCYKKFTQRNLLQSHQEEHLRSPDVSEPIRQLLSSKGSLGLSPAANEIEETDQANTSSACDIDEDSVSGFEPSQEDSGSIS